MDFGEFTIDGLVDTGALSSAIPIADLNKIRLMTPKSILDEGEPPNFHIIVANGGIEHPTGTVLLHFEVGDLEFKEWFIIMKNLTNPIIGLAFLQRNNTVLDMRQAVLNFPFFSMRLETTDKPTPNTQEPLILKQDLILKANEITTIKVTTLKLNEHKVTGIIQPTEMYDGQGTVLVCPALTTLEENSVIISLNNTSSLPVTVAKNTHLATFSVLTPREHKELQPVNPAVLKYIADKSPKDTYQYVNELLKQPRDQDIKDHYWFPTPENPGDPSTHTPIQARILAEFYELERLEKLDPTKDVEQRQEFLSNFSWEDSTLTEEEREQVKEILVEYNDIFARHRFDIGFNSEFTVKLTPTDERAAYSQSLPTPVHLKDDITVELAMLHKYGIITTLTHSKYASPIFAQRKPNGRLRLLVDLRKINSLITEDYTNHNYPVSTLSDAAQHMAGKRLFCKLDCSQAYHCLQMADKQSVEMLAFNFASRTFAYRRLAQGLSRSLSAFSSFMREYLDPVVKADQCAQYVDDIGIAANEPNN